MKLLITRRGKFGFLKKQTNAIYYPKTFRDIEKCRIEISLSFFRTLKLINARDMWTSVKRTQWSWIRCIFGSWRSRIKLFPFQLWVQQSYSFTVSTYMSATPTENIEFSKGPRLIRRMINRVLLLRDRSTVHGIEFLPCIQSEWSNMGQQCHIRRLVGEYTGGTFTKGSRMLVGICSIFEICRKINMKMKLKIYFICNNWMHNRRVLTLVLTMFMEKTNILWYKVWTIWRWCSKTQLWCLNYHI